MDPAELEQATGELISLTIDTVAAAARGEGPAADA